MESVYFEVPVLGLSYVMFFDYFKFNLEKGSILFDCYIENQPAIATLYRTRKNHSEIIQFIEDTSLLPIMMEKINKYKYEITFEKNYQNLESVINMLHLVFPDRKISLEIKLFSDHYSFGRCTLHLIDLYEMGYLTLVNVNIPQPFYQRYKTRIYTGLYIIARNPFEKYHYDSLELNFFNNIKNEFLRLSFDMMLQDQPFMKNHLNSLIKDMISTIPLNQNEHKKLFHDWKQYHDLEIKMSDLRIPLKEWKPSLFLKSVSKLLDMFPNYFINPRFNLDISISNT